MFLLQKLWIKKHKKHLTLITLLLVLTNFTTFYYCMSKGWILKYIEAERRAEACLPMQPKIVKKNLI
jgi:hypothetical protein